jgi:predicted ribonuclease toxin of YeeF-YezG toxin-antitoxin module
MDVYAKSVIKMVLEMSRKRSRDIGNDRGIKRQKIKDFRDSRDSGNRHDKFSIKKGRDRRRNQLEHKIKYSGKTLKFDGLFEDYLRDVEECTGRKISKEQIKLLKNALENGRYTKLTPDENHKNRSKFNGRKAKISAEWEEHYHQNWPTYEEDVLTKKGKVARRKGGRLDMHHLIECSWNGDAEWWNVHPAKNPREHQQGIHRKGGYCDRIDNLLKGA